MPKGSKLSRLLFALGVLLFVTAVYLFGYPQTNVAYAAAIILHLLGGILAAILLVPFLWHVFRNGTALEKTAWIVFATGTIVGLALIKVGTRHADYNVLYTHIVLCLVAVTILFAQWLGHKGILSANPAGMAGRLIICAALLAAISYGAWHTRHTLWQNSAVIKNPKMPPASMDFEGDGSNGAFFPSSAQIKSGEKIPSKFFMESDSCQRCHQDIYKQWYSSAHHFSSFNNQWYRKSVEYMQDVVGTKPSKWCGGCHDPAVLYAGKMDTPIKQIVHTPEAQAGLGCMMCHSIAQVKSTMGQGDFFLEYPKLHELAASKNPAMVWLHDFMVRLNPEPHRRVFLKPFMKNQTAEFCASCHKVHLDVPVNNYRWVRGFNEYDNWQASGVSGQGARSFYYPEKPQKCADCHMPLEKSKDDGNIAGFVHSHRFPGANTALPTANEDAEQLKITEDFLKSGALTIDIFALSRASEAKASGAALPSTEMSTTFAVGEEAEAKAPAAATTETAPVTAPLNRVNAVVHRGEDVRVDVVVRTKKVGHFFPGGTVDAYDTWVELKASDENGKPIFWSGMVEDGGKGPVEKGAHFYRSLGIDAHGTPINKRNAWANRAVVYVRLIPPGAADTIHYRLRIPENAGNKIKLEAKLNYRKFAWWNTQFSFAGVPHPEKAIQRTADYDDTQYVFTGELKGLSTKQQKIPDVPIVVVAQNDVTLDVAAKNAAIQPPKTQLAKEDWQRWNDYGIGLLLQGDLKAAQEAFRKVTEIDPNNPDGWVNIGRAAVQEGDMELARNVLDRALQINPKLARTNFFYAKVLRSDGNYDGAAEHLRTVLAQYPRDRVALNDLGRILFLQHKYKEAVAPLEQVLEVDPEDLQAHYNLMLSYRGQGDAKQAREHEVRYLRFKADESAQAITGPYRQRNPEDNNERQSIHEHVSVPLHAKTRATKVASGASNRSGASK
jgi:tetratricopeptide (TPR) repeat protein